MLIVLFDISLPARLLVLYLLFKESLVLSNNILSTIELVILFGLLLSVSLNYLRLRVVTFPLIAGICTVASCYSLYIRCGSKDIFQMPLLVSPDIKANTSLYFMFSPCISALYLASSVIATSMHSRRCMNT